MSQECPQPLGHGSGGPARPPIREGGEVGIQIFRAQGREIAIRLPAPAEEVRDAAAAHGNGHRTQSPFLAHPSQVLLQWLCKRDWLFLLAPPAEELQPRTTKLQ